MCPTTKGTQAYPPHERVAKRNVNHDTVGSNKGVGGREKFLNVMVTFCITLKSYHMICESVAEIISHDF